MAAGNAEWGGASVPLLWVPVPQDSSQLWLLQQCQGRQNSAFLVLKVSKGQPSSPELLSISPGCHHQLICHVGILGADLFIKHFFVSFYLLVDLQLQHAKRSWIHFCSTWQPPEKCLLLLAVYILAGLLKAPSPCRTFTARDEVQNLRIQPGYKSSDCQPKGFFWKNYREIPMGSQWGRKRTQELDPRIRVWWLLLRTEAQLKEVSKGNPVTSVPVWMPSSWQDSCVLEPQPPVWILGNRRNLCGTEATQGQRNWKNSHISIMPLKPWLQKLTFPSGNSWS